MQAFNLSNSLASQSLTTTQDNNSYVIRIKECNGSMVADVTCNGVSIVSGKRIVQATPILPFPYLEGNNGNFLFICQTEDVIDYALFGLTQILYYFSYDEMIALAT
jgi:hypothetical protein